VGALSGEIGLKKAGGEMIGDLKDTIDRAARRHET